MVKNLNTTDEGTKVRAGHKAGYINQGENSVAVGIFAGYQDQPANTNVINATGQVLNGVSNLNPTPSGGTFIAPIASGEDRVLTYDINSNEVKVSSKLSGDIGGGTQNKVSLQTVTDGTNPITPGVAPFNSTKETCNFTANQGLVGTNNNDDAITVGGRIGFNNNITSVVIGDGGSQNANSNVERVAIGRGTGQVNQGVQAIAIGSYSGNTNQGDNSIAIGNASGILNVSSNTISIGLNSGQSYNKEGSIAIGINAGQTQDPITSNTNRISIGTNSGNYNQGEAAIAIGLEAGKGDDGVTQQPQNSNAIAVGRQSGFLFQGQSSVAIGIEAGKTNQGASSVAIGPYAGRAGISKPFCIAIGNYAGENNQGQYSIAIGNNAGQNTQDEGCIAMGLGAGQSGQLNNAIAIGVNAAASNITKQGNNSIAIGKDAGITTCVNNSIVINATGNPLQAPTSGLFIKPIALGNEDKVLTWNNVSGEIKASDVVVPNHYAVVVSESLLSTIHSSPGTYLRLPHNLNTPTDYDKYRICFRAFSMSHPNGSTQVTNNVTVGTSVLNQVGNVISAGPNTAFNSYNVFSNSPYTNKIEFKDATHLFEQNYFDTNYMCVRYIDKYNENITLAGSGPASGFGPVEYIDFGTTPPTTYYYPPIASSSWLTKSGGNTEFYLFVIYKI